MLAGFALTLGCADLKALFVEPPEVDHPTADMVSIPAGTASLGEWKEERLFHAKGHPCYAVMKQEMSWEAFEIERHPFPGEGYDWPADGLNLPKLEQLLAVMADYGRRACTPTELLVASAGTGNHRYPYHPRRYDPSLCEADDQHPSGPIGSHPGCASPLDVRDFAVRASWAKRSAAPIAVELPNLKTDYLIVGMVSRRDTFYCPSNFGAHTHQPDEPEYLDDSVRFCATPGERTNRKDAALVDIMERCYNGTYQSIIDCK